MRVLFPFIGTTVGGSHLADIQLYRTLKSQGEDPLILLHKQGKLADYLTQNGVVFDCYSDGYVPQSLKELLCNVYHYWQAIKRAASYLHDNKIEAVYCSDGPLIYIWFFAARRANVPFVLTQHGRIQNTWIKRYIYQHVDGLVCNSHFSSCLLPAKPRNGYYVIAHPNTEHAPRRSLSRPQEIKTEGFNIGYVANMRDWKRPFLFIDMAKQLAEKYENMHFYMVGQPYGALEQTVPAYVSERGLQDRLTLCGFQSDTASYIAAFDVLVCPSVCEPFGLTLIEASLLQTPVIASRSGGHEDIILDQETGLFAEADNVADFVRKVEQLYADQNLRAQIQKNAEKRARFVFSAETQNQKIISLLQDILNER